MCLQTGVNPEHLQAARKALKKQKEKANGNHSPPLKLCAKVSLSSLPGCVYTQSALLTITNIARADLTNVARADLTNVAQASEALKGSN